MFANTHETCEEEKAVMRRIIIISVTMAVLLTGSLARAQVCEIVNNSFEDDGWISDITVKEPNGWDVDLPAGKFRGYVYTDWASDPYDPNNPGPYYSLTVYSQWFTTFTTGDMATVSQDVNLTNVDEVVFDLKLDTLGNTLWDPSVCTAVLLIDDEVVWEANSVGSDVRGEYLGQAYVVEARFKDGSPHKLSMGLRINVAEMLFERYAAYWDFFECVSYCDGNGLLAGDFNRDCFVDANDLQLMTDVWLEEVGLYDPYNLFRFSEVDLNGVVNFLDFTVFAENWLGNSYEQGQ